MLHVFQSVAIATTFMNLFLFARDILTTGNPSPGYKFSLALLCALVTGCIVAHFA